MTAPLESPSSPSKLTFNGIFLVGFMGAGKTSVGHALAKTLGWRFVDLDERIVLRAGRSVAEIFEQEGETKFREMEHAELRRLLDEFQSENTVVSLGGGAWTQPTNVALITKASLPVFFLDAPVEELWRRCRPEHGLRPLLQDKIGFSNLYTARRPAYLDGTLRVETHERSVEEVARHIALLLGLAGTDSAT